MIPTTEELRARISLGREPVENLQAALDRMFGLTHHPKLVSDAHGFKRVTQGEPLPGPLTFESLAEAYATYTGDSNFQRVGQPRITQLGMPDFPSALANTMNALLLRDYADDSSYRWREIVTSFTSPENFKPQRRSRARYVEDLPTVGEDENFDELVTHGDEGFEYAVSKKGGLLTLTRTAIINDDVGLVGRLVAQAGRAAWRTLAKRAWGRIINNDTYEIDALPMFDAAHGNLGSAALSVTVLNAARAAIFAQTESGSTERLGLSGPWLLVVPVELEPTAFGINESEFVPGTTDGSASPWHKRFGDHGERIFANPLFTDQTDWALFDVGGNAGILEVGFLMGRQNPEIFVANDERADATFSSDRYTWKLRHEYEVVIADYRASYKSVVG